MCSNLYYLSSNQQIKEVVQDIQKARKDQVDNDEKQLQVRIDALGYRFDPILYFIISLNIEIHGKSFESCCHSKQTQKRY